jgi:small-conductance mechanosensitive channel
VRAAYGTEPERVIQILLDVARGHPKVLSQPAPDAVFVGFGPSALDFLLMFWAEQDTHFRLRSEVSIGVNAALRQAGIEVPVPQQDVRVLALENPAARRAAGSGGP